MSTGKHLRPPLTKWNLSETHAGASLLFFKDPHATRVVAKAISSGIAIQARLCSSLLKTLLKALFSDSRLNHHFIIRMFICIVVKMFRTRYLSVNLN